MKRKKIIRRAKKRIKQWSWYDTLIAILLIGTGIFIFKSGTMQEFFNTIAKGLFMALFIGLILSQIVKIKKRGK